MEILQSKPKESYSRYSSLRAAVHIPFVLSIGYCSFCLYDKKNIIRWRRDLFSHENIKLLSLSQLEMFSCNLRVIFERPGNIVFLNLMKIKRALVAVLVLDFLKLRLETSRHLTKSRGLLSGVSWVVRENNVRFYHIGPDGPDVEKCVRYINHEIRKNLFITQLMAFFERFSHLYFC